MIHFDTLSEFTGTLSKGVAEFCLSKLPDKNEFYHRNLMRELGFVLPHSEQVWCNEDYTLHYFCYSLEFHLLLKTPNVVRFVPKFIIHAPKTNSKNIQDFGKYARDVMIPAFTKAANNQFYLGDNLAPESFVTLPIPSWSNAFWFEENRCDIMFLSEAVRALGEFSEKALKHLQQFQLPLR